MLDRIAVGLGPDSYHGIRAAIAMAEGWVLARKTPRVGVSSVAALALQWGREHVDGRFAVAVDAQRGEFYRADYLAEAGVAREVQPLRLVKAAEIESCLRAGETVCGPDVARRFAGAHEAFPNASAVSCLASGIPEAVASAPLEPTYLRERAFVKAPPARLA